MSVTTMAKRSVGLFANLIVIRGSSSPVVDGIAKALIARVSHLYSEHFSAAFSYRGNSAQNP
jgi:hypothetical protein